MELGTWVRNNCLLTISAILAAVSFVLVPIDTIVSYDYWRILLTIGTLLCFLLIVAGLRECAVLDVFAKRAVGKITSVTSLCLVLVFLPFFFAMLFTNDVALVTMIPLAIIMLDRAGMRGHIPLVIVLQTAAANVGGSLTPFGNPHNLYIYNLKDVYGFSLMDFLSALFPVVVTGAVVILIMTLLVKHRPLEADAGGEVSITDKGTAIALAVLFILSVLTVVTGFPLIVTLLVVVAVITWRMPRVFLKTDYTILFVFFFLFVFVNSVANIGSVRGFLVDSLSAEPLLTSVWVSQFTSNLPAAVMLQPFTDRWDAVLVGTDIGCFGTPIASMANVLAIRFYLRERDADPRKFFGIFAVVNVLMIAVMCAGWYLFG